MNWKIIFVILGVFSAISSGIVTVMTISYRIGFNAMIFILIFVLSIISTIYAIKHKLWAKVTLWILGAISVFLVVIIKAIFTPVYVLTG